MKRSKSYGYFLEVLGEILEVKKSVFTEPNRCFYFPEGKIKILSEILKSPFVIIKRPR